MFLEILRGQNFKHKLLLQEYQRNRAELTITSTPHRGTKIRMCWKADQTVTAACKLDFLSQAPALRLHMRAIIAFS